MKVILLTDTELSNFGCCVPDDVLQGRYAITLDGHRFHFIPRPIYERFRKDRLNMLYR
jgi:hypothetical protein